MTRPRLLSGLDVLLRDPSSLRGLKLGLVANPASVTSRFVPTARALLEAGLDLKLLFGPEHGLTGAVQDMLAVGEDDTPKGRIPVASLYGERFEDLSPRPEHLAALDAVVCDLPDVGSRYYTFVWTTFLVLKACAAAAVPSCNPGNSGCYIRRPGLFRPPLSRSRRKIHRRSPHYA